MITETRKNHEPIHQEQPQVHHEISKPRRKRDDSISVNVGVSESKKVINALIFLLRFLTMLLYFQPSILAVGGNANNLDGLFDNNVMLTKPEEAKARANLLSLQERTGCASAEEFIER